MTIHRASIALGACTWLLCQPAAAQTVVEIARTPEGCRIYLSGKDFIAEGCNIHVRDSSGFTWCDHLNATPPTTDNCDNTGNIIVGWNEDTAGPYARTGNHNLIVGDEHNYTAYGALVAGRQNSVSGPYTTIVGGETNRASGENASICGGVNALAAGENSTIAGGISNEVTSASDQGTVLGGANNSVSGNRATVVGGSENKANGNFSTVVGSHTVTVDADDSGGVVLGQLMVATGTVPMPANSSGSTVISANGRSALYEISFGQSMPCRPVVTTQMFNSGSGQVAPFILSINSVTETSFTYYLTNPSSSSQSAYTATIYWTAICQ